MLVIMVTWFGAFTALDCTVITLFCWPILPALLKTALIVPLLPGAIGSFGHSGVVQPQVTSTCLITSGALPVFLNLKTCSTMSPCLMLPKSCFVSAKVITGPAVVVFVVLVFLSVAVWADATPMVNDIETARMNNFFILIDTV